MHKPETAYFLLVGVILQTLGCGMGTPRALQSVTVNPVMADAKDFPNEQVQFTATGVFNKAPVRVTPFPVAWSVGVSSIATIDQNGLAQCVPGKAGSVTIQIAAQGDGPLMNVSTLTCP
jgi:hypothetical protein